MILFADSKGPDQTAGWSAQADLDLRCPHMPEDGHSILSADLRRAIVSIWRKNVHNTG